MTRDDEGRVSRWNWQAVQGVGRRGGDSGSTEEKQRSTRSSSREVCCVPLSAMASRGGTERALCFQSGSMHGTCRGRLHRGS